MSFILEALRKSEHERQRQAGPALVEAVVARPKGRSNPWATALVALLVVNLVAVGVLLMMRSNGGPAAGPTPPTAQTQSAPTDAGAPAAASSAVSPVSAAPAPALARPVRPPVPDTPPMLSPAVPPRAPGSNPLEREVVGEPAEPVSEALAQAARPPAGPPAVVEAPVRRGTVVYQPLPEAEPVASRPPASPQAVLPTADELTARGGLAELRLELHVYSNRPPERFVFVNGRRYREGDTTQEGATVDEITPEGVVMSLRGNRFLLPRE